jgi:alkanesulfonate monooxygenase SsuD/methylene tetrahydromethanopterin reductase-like flavin-dependent oxidoreductase (luciferase family)
VCDAVEGLFLNDLDVDALQARAEQARNDGVDVVFLADSPLGDAIVLAAGLAAGLAAAGPSELLFGVRISLGPQPHRHPTILGREMTTLDHVSGGRSILAFTSPFTPAVGEAITLCRDMWRKGIAVSDGPHFPVVGAINRPLPKSPGGPPIALDLTDGAVAEPALLGACDLVLLPAGAASPDSLPPSIEVCWIQET